MISYTAYKVLHVTAIFLLYTALGGVALASTEGALQNRSVSRKVLGIAHGVALAMLLITGMGLLARLGMGGTWPLWVWVKIGIWLVLGAATALIRRLPAHFAWLIFLLPLIGTIAAYMALYKPGPG